MQCKILLTRYGKLHELFRQNWLDLYSLQMNKELEQMLEFKSGLLTLMDNVLVHSKFKKQAETQWNVEWKTKSRESFLFRQYCTITL